MCEIYVIALHRHPYIVHIWHHDEKHVLVRPSRTIVNTIYFIRYTEW